MSNATTITAPSGQPFIEVARDFDAPVAAVFRAHTDPALFSRWTGPRSMQMDHLELDARTGGRWNYTFRGQNNAEYGFCGVFHSVEPNRLIIQTFEFSMAPGQVGIGSIRFEEIDGRTRLASREMYPSVEARDMALASGMEHGINESYERLDEILTATTSR
jgi:uncharacterized protein YndB with AHSA1/START domain